MKNSELALLVSAFFVFESSEHKKTTAVVSNRSSSVK
jgi:hypothetical protein